MDEFEWLSSYDNFDTLFPFAISANEIQYTGCLKKSGISALRSFYGVKVGEKRPHSNSI